MKQCKKCGASLPDDAAFCAICGASVAQTHEIICPSCHQPTSADQLFCPHCGHRIVAQPTPEPSPIPESQTTPRPQPEPQPSNEAKLNEIRKVCQVNGILSLFICLALSFEIPAISLSFVSYRSFSELLTIFLILGIAAYIAGLILISSYKKLAIQALNSKDPRVRAGYERKAKHQLKGTYFIILFTMVIGFLFFGIDW